MLVVLGTAEDKEDTGSQVWCHRPGPELVDTAALVPMWYQHWAAQADRMFGMVKVVVEVEGILGQENRLPIGTLGFHDHPAKRKTKPCKKY